MTRAAVVALVLVPSVAAADPKGLTRPGEKSCTTIERVAADDTVDATFHVWTDAKGRPTGRSRASRSRRTA